MIREMQCCGSGIRRFFEPWILDRFFPDPGSRIQDPKSRIQDPETHIYESLVKNFWVKKNTVVSILHWSRAPM